ncbi:meiotically up-regulated protein [Metarhizium rileyi]|uniref:Meiotically up-regulated protein n=1 Tax=Metarhizium rileyi (strain RCEF 4871) TaxID=1649241 RepID=A0A162M2H1_METRR|nr:meiotically up-regulated protein [Metarhizium rileyi RCEF 4871]TWU78081.1 hypothetical protein ED733_007013 [Metarhizium rileyi]
MGAHQSVPGAQSEETGINISNTCYYELIGVDADATDTEIKKSYRKKALELHPDRNLNNVQEATRKFAEIQAAYEVLSDPQERAWYDSHRDSILALNDPPGNSAGQATFRNVRLTTTEEIYSLIRRFNATIPFNDQPTGFFGVCRETFDHLALEEETAAEVQQIEFTPYRTFGSSYDDYETVAKPFYASWSGFSTRKSFSWKDKYRLSDAPDRRTRRLMEKENKKCRDDASREFNDAVRFLVTFVRKRDPRHSPNFPTDTERQKHLRNAAAAQAARSRAANRQKFESYVAPAWSQPQDEHGLADYFSETEEDSEVEILECFVCRKYFKSVQQLEVHERSKKHVKAVQHLRKQMKKEDLALELDLALDQETDQRQPRTVSQKTELVVPSITEAGSFEAGPTTHWSADGEACLQADIGLSKSPSVQDGDYAPRDEVKERLCLSGSKSCDVVGDTTEDHVVALTDSICLDKGPVPTEGKVGKAKAKRQKKVARQLEDAKAQVRCHGPLEASTD